MTAQEAVGALKLINLKSVHPFYDWEEMHATKEQEIEAWNRRAENAGIHRA